MFSFFTGTSSEKPQLRHEIIDEHLFVEALAIVGLSDYQTDDVDREELSDKGSYQDEDEPFARADFEEDVSELSPVEKVLQLVERIANSDGIYGR